MTLIRIHIRRPFAITLLVITLVVGIASVALFTTFRTGHMATRDISWNQRALLMKCALVHVANEIDMDIRHVSVDHETMCGDIDQGGASNIGERMKRLGHRIPSGWGVLLARANSTSELLPDNFFSSSPTQMVEVTVTHKSSSPNSRPPSKHCECIVSLPLVVVGDQELLGIVWYSFMGSNGGGNGVVVCSQAAGSSEWVAVQLNPIGVY
ncbi:MAG: hypothetical protein WCJ09_18335 [Planctomycetota bacterium]